MNSLLKIFLVATGLLAGCASARSSRNGSDRDHFANRQTITGSNIPTRRDELPTSPVSATSPPESLSRDRPSLYPTEPVVGRNPRQDLGTQPVNTGAGPAGSNPVLPINGNQ